MHGLNQHADAGVRHAAAGVRATTHQLCYCPYAKDILCILYEVAGTLVPPDDVHMQDLLAVCDSSADTKAMRETLLRYTSSTSTGVVAADGPSKRPCTTNSHACCLTHRLAPVRNGASPRVVTVHMGQGLGRGHKRVEIRLVLTSTGRGERLFTIDLNSDARSLDLSTLAQQQLHRTTLPLSKGSNGANRKGARLRTPAMTMLPLIHINNHVSILNVLRGYIDNWMEIVTYCVENLSTIEQSLKPNTARVSFFASKHRRAD